ncbi:integrase core domain-containing protein [Segatella albensis]|uniref:integrase core domain-containing protein n=1 Tax=Segatella albensis TaxID=77768 RepID=UPI001EE1D72E|nr:integrase core domain-containing protein [Segatella albensis]
MGTSRLSQGCHYNADLTDGSRSGGCMSGIDTLKGLIHYSDRGVQYCCDAYVKMLQTYGCTISMTEDYKPTDNAIAESVNGKIKVESVYRQKRFNSLVHAGNVIGRYIHFYNYHRPHMSIGLRCRLLPIWSKASREKCGRTKLYKKLYR